MENSIKKGRSWIIAVFITTLIFMILHNHDLYFQESGNRILLNLFRIFVFFPLLYFLYKHSNWARVTLGAISAIMVMMGIAGLLFFFTNWANTSDILYLGVMWLCMLFNTIVLFFCRDVINYVNIKPETDV